MSNILNSLDDTISISEVDNCDKEVKLLLGSSCIIDFPVIKHKLKDICLMSSEFGIQGYVVVGKVGNHDSACDLGEIHAVRHAEIVKITPLYDVCEDVVAFVETNKTNLFSPFITQ